MSDKLRPRQYADPKGIIVEGFDGNAILAEGSAVPTDATAGYAPGCHFIKRAGAAGDQVYVNQGTAASCLFKALPDLTTSLLITAGVAGVAGGYKVARGTTALDGSNPTPVATGLATVVSATVTLEGSSAPGLGTSTLTQANTDWGTGALAVYAWKPTSISNPTLIASTGTETFDWIAIGT